MRCCNMMLQGSKTSESDAGLLAERTFDYNILIIKESQKEVCNMSKGTVICFGDSNTWGFDPSTGKRYPADGRWVDILAELTGWDTVNVGMNGRQIPHTDAELAELTALLDNAAAGQYQAPVELWILLGANDIQSNYGFTAEDVCARMKKLLLELLWHEAVMNGTVSLRVLGPAQTKVGPWSDEHMVEELRRAGGLLYKLMCRELNIAYTDLGTTDIELAEDGDHFTPAGHKAVAELLAGLLAD